MKKFNLTAFIGGWFIGNFNPSIIDTETFEIAIKKYVAGDKEQKHLHKVADEITVIVIGKVKMNDIIYSTDDIIYIEKNEPTDFMCLEDTITCVIKIPSHKNDKYIL